MSETLDLNVPDPRLQQAEALNNYGCQLRNSGHWESALIAYQRAIALAPLNAQIWGNIGCVLWNMGRLDEAEPALRTAIMHEPNAGIHYGNYALLLSTMRRYEEADAAYESAIQYAASRKEELNAIWDRALVRIERGDWARGFVDYDVRMELRGAPHYLKMPLTMWEGQPLDGKTLYVQAEQGLGDRILFSRYFAEVHKLWPTCKIVACVNERMVNLFWEFRHFVEFLPQGVPWPKADYGLFMGSFPRWMTLSPAEIPPDPGLIRKRVAEEHAKGSFNCPEPNLPALKVGIAWTGNPEQIRNRERSIPLDQMLTLARNPNVVLYSFQVGAGSEQIAQHGAHELVCDISRDLENNGLVAAGVAMMDMDLIITVCTATAHLAGAVGVPCWTLLCHDPYWVWLQDEDRRTDSPWYPKTKLYRQDRPFDWSSVLERVRSDLDQLCHVVMTSRPLKEAEDGERSRSALSRSRDHLEPPQG